MSGAEKLVEQIIETLNKNKGVNIVKIDLRRIEKPTRNWEKNHYTWKENNKPSGWCWITEMWLYIYFKKNNEIIIKLKIFGLTQK